MFQPPVTWAWKKPWSPYWPSFSCPECQLSAPAEELKAPLVLLSLMGTPFERIAMDLVGPLMKSVTGFQYSLMVVDYATHLPEAMPLKSATT